MGQFLKKLAKKIFLKNAILTPTFWKDASRKHCPCRKEVKELKKSVIKNWTIPQNLSSIKSHPPFSFVALHVQLTNSHFLIYFSYKKLFHQNTKRVLTLIRKNSSKKGKSHLNLVRLLNPYQAKK
jgi:hypothetical protein